MAFETWILGEFWQRILQVLVLEHVQIRRYLKKEVLRLQLMCLNSYQRIHCLGCSLNHCLMSLDANCGSSMLVMF